MNDNDDDDDDDDGFVIIMMNMCVQIFSFYKIQLQL